MRDFVPKSEALITFFNGTVQLQSAVRIAHALWWYINE
jgi:hypothetical protein